MNQIEKIYQFNQAIAPYNNQDFLYQSFKFNSAYKQAFLSLPHFSKMQFYRFVQQKKIYGQIADQQTYQLILKQINFIVAPLHFSQKTIQIQSPDKKIQNKINQLYNVTSKVLDLPLLNDQSSLNNLVKSQKIQISTNSNQQKLKTNQIQNTKILNLNNDSFKSNVEENQQFIKEQGLQNNLGPITDFTAIKQANFLTLIPIKQNSKNIFNQNKSLNINQKQEQNQNEEWNQGQYAQTFQLNIPQYQRKQFQKRVQNIKFSSSSRIENMIVDQKLQSIWEIQKYVKEIKEKEINIHEIFKSQQKNANPMKELVQSSSQLQQINIRFNQFSEIKKQNSIQNYKCEKQKTQRKQKKILEQTNVSQQACSIETSNKQILNEKFSFNYQQIQMTMSINLQTINEYQIKNKQNLFQNLPLLIKDSLNFQEKTFIQKQNKNNCNDQHNLIFKQQAKKQKQTNFCSILQVIVEQSHIKDQKIFFNQNKQQKYSIKNQTLNSNSTQKKQFLSFIQQEPQIQFLPENKNQTKKPQQQEQCQSNIDQSVNNFQNQKINKPNSDLGFSFSNNYFINKLQIPQKKNNNKKKDQREQCKKQSKISDSIFFKNITQKFTESQQRCLQSLKIEIKNEDKEFLENALIQNKYLYNKQFYEKVANLFKRLDLQEHEDYKQIKKGALLVVQIQELVEKFSRVITEDEEPLLTRILQNQKEKHLFLEKLSPIIKEKVFKAIKLRIGSIYKIGAVLLQLSLNTEIVSRLAQQESAFQKLSFFFILQKMNIRQNFAQQCEVIISYSLKQYKMYKKYLINCKFNQLELHYNFSQYLKGIISLANLCARALVLIKVCTFNQPIDFAQATSFCRQLANLVVQPLISQSAIKLLKEIILKGSSLYQIHNQFFILYKKQPLCRFCLTFGGNGSFVDSLWSHYACFNLHRIARNTLDC